MENNEIPILENAFDLWLDNKFEYTGSTIARRWESVSPDVQKYVSYLISKDEIQKIKTYQKEIFESCVEVFVTELKAKFNNDTTSSSKYSDSDKIERYKCSVIWLLDDAPCDKIKFSLPYMKDPERFIHGLKSITIKDIRDCYKDYFSYDILNYSWITASMKETGLYQDTVEVVVVGYIRFLDWLKEKKDTPKSVDGKKDWKPDPTKAMKAINRLNTYLESACKDEHGKRKPKSHNEIISTALNQTYTDLGIQERQLTRFVKYIYSKTVKEYAGHYVGHFFSHK